MSRALKELKKTAKFIHYVLAVRPDQFGLLPDSQGFYKLKTFFQAMAQDPLGKKIRPALLRQMALSLDDVPFQLRNDLIRPRNTRDLPAWSQATELPKLLYTTVRRRAHAHVVDKGIGGQIILCADKEFALKLGRRKDQSPVLLTVNTDQATRLGVSFKRFGKLLYVADHIPTGCFTGPRVATRPAPGRNKSGQGQGKKPKTAGSFLVDPAAISNATTGKPRLSKRDKGPAWKRLRRKSRKR